MRLILSLLLLIALTFSTGCSSRPVQIVPDMGWVQPIHFSDETKEWLLSQPWPESAYGDFDKIGKHNKKYYRFVKHRLPGD